MNVNDFSSQNAIRIYNFIKTNSMIYREANLDDAIAITSLNNKYHRAFLSNNKEKGFLKSQFNLEEIHMLINVDEVVVAVDQNEVIGYYLVNNLHNSQAMNMRKNRIRELVADGILPNVRYVYHTQAVVDEPYMGKGIGKELLENLRLLVSSKYDYMIGYIDSENLNASIAHQKSGWKIFTEVDGGCLAMISTKICRDY
jgi:GNAT superfamily N-acetyltransferase